MASRFSVRTSIDAPTANPFRLCGLEVPFVTACASAGQIFVGAQVAVSAGGVVEAPNDMAAQTRIILKNVDRALTPFDATLADVVKLNTYYVGSNGAQKALEARGEFFGLGPVSTGVGAASVGLRDLTISIEAVAMPGQKKMFDRGVDDYGYHPESLPFRVIGRAGELPWIAGVSATHASGETLAVGDARRQTEITLDVLRRRLAAVGASLDDVALIRAYWSADAADIPECAELRDRSFRRRPPVVDVVIPGFPSSALLIEMDVVGLASAGQKLGLSREGLNVHAAAGLVYAGLHLAQNGQRRGDLGQEIESAIASLDRTLHAADSEVGRLVHLHLYYTGDVDWATAVRLVGERVHVDMALTTVGVTRFPTALDARIGLDAVAAPST